VDRIQQGLASTIQVELYRAGALENPSPDSATVTITASDGTVLVSSATADDEGTGVFAYTLSPAQTATLDTLTAAWTVEFDGVAQTVQTTVEIVGGFIVSLHELAGVLTSLTQAQLAEKRVRIEQRLEKALRYACVPRYSLETRYSRAGDILTRHRFRAVRSIVVLRPNMADWTLSGGQLANLSVEPWGVRGVPAVGTVRIGYEHGRDYPDSDITEAALLLADEAYGTSGVDGRVLSQSADNMAVTYVSSGGGPFVNARLNQIVKANRLPGVA
jgi:hypothetical protein